MKWLFSQLRKLITFLLPKEERFFDLFIEMLQIVVKCLDLIKNAEAAKVNQLVDDIEELEDKSDFLEHTIQQRLRASITTPPQLNREAILQIASTIDNVTDSMKSLSKRLQCGKGEIVTILKGEFPEYDMMIDKLIEATEYSMEIMKDFSVNRIETSDPRMKKVHDIENQIDTIHISFITEKMYYSDLRGRHMVIMQIIGRLEGAGDELQRLVKIIEGVLVSG
ncbi:MAG: DUF47 domain-containing protein [Vulcanimicrobiota bacterium]